MEQLTLEKSDESMGLFDSDYDNEYKDSIRTEEHNYVIKESKKDNNQQKERDICDMSK